LWFILKTQQKTLKKQPKNNPTVLGSCKKFFYEKDIAFKDLITTHEQVVLNILKDRKRRVLLNKDFHINIMC